MDRMPLITIIVPAYNVEAWLPRCLDSVLAQTYANLEVLVINDGSTDGTEAIIDTYAKSDQRVVAIHQANAGLIEVRETGIQLAKGEYIGFVDGDDTIEPDMFKRLLNNALKYDAAISQCGMLYCFYDGRKKPMHGTGKLTVYSRSDGCRALLHGEDMEPSLCNKLYRREILKESCLDRSVMNNEDLLRNFVLFSRADRSVLEDFCGYHYWRRAGSMSNDGFQAKRCQDLVRARSLILENAEDDLRSAAMQSYVNALISCYNSAVGVRTEDACGLRGECKKNLGMIRGELSLLPKGLYLRALGILNLPWAYHAVIRFHNVQVKRRIKLNAAKVQENKNT